MKQLIIAVALMLSFSGCARFSTTQTDTSYEKGQPARKIATKAAGYTLFSAKSALANWKASQTDKTQGASVGSLNQETDAAAQLVPVLSALLEAAVKAATKGAAPAP